MVSILKQLLHFFPPHFLTLQPYSTIESIIFSLNILHTTPHNDNVIFFVLHFFPNVSKKQIKLRNHMKRSIQSLGFVLCKCIYSLNSFRKGSCQLGTLWTVWPLSSQHHQAGRGQSAFSDYLWRCLWGVLAGPLQDLHSRPEATALMPRPKDQLPAQSEVQSSLSSRMSLAVSPWPLEFCKT